MNLNLYLFKLITCVYITKQMRYFFWILHPSLPTAVTLFDKVRGSYCKTGSCLRALGELEKNFNSRKYFILQCIVLPGPGSAESP